MISSTAVFFSCFVLSFVAGSFIIQPQGTKAVTGLGLVTTPSLTISADGTISLSPNPTANSGMAASTGKVTTSTDAPTGYNLSISAITDPTFTPTTGTITSPTALTSNTWGYALASSTAVGVTNGFDASYTTPAPSPSSKWANPSNSVIIKNTSTTASNDQTNVYYGAKIDLNTPSGNYKNTVTYTAIANTSTIPTPSITSISPATGNPAGGTALTIVGTGFTVNDASITSAVTIGGKACTNVSISSNTPGTGKDTVYCKTPAGTAGAVNVSVSTWGGTTAKAGGFTYTSPAAAGVKMQDVTEGSCPTTRTRANDARDNNSYWIQRLADGQCWMLTNLAYGGGGDNTYGDTKTLMNGVGYGYTYTVARYYPTTDANPTSGTTDPSTSTDGGATNPQYGYLYNWCAAMGAQVGTDACSSTDTTDVDPAISICPSGWHLPSTSENANLNNNVNSGLTNSSAGLLTAWLGMYSGRWRDGFSSAGDSGPYWAANQPYSGYAYAMIIYPSSFYSANNFINYSGLAVRCLAN